MDYLDYLTTFPLIINDPTIIRLPVLFSGDGVKIHFKGCFLRQMRKGEPVYSPVSGIAASLAHITRCAIRVNILKMTQAI